MKPIYIEHNGIRYRLGRVNGPRYVDCTKRCAFRKHDGGRVDPDGYCCNGCYLPKWFNDLAIPEAWLERV